MRRLLMAVPLMLLMSSVALAGLASDDSDASGVTVIQDPSGTGDARTFGFRAPVPVTWDFPDGTSSVGTYAEHRFGTSGLHTVGYAPLDGSSGSYTAVIVSDPAPVTEAFLKTEYVYCPGIVDSVSSDCPGLVWSGETMTLSGTPTRAGEYNVSVVGTDGTASSFVLKVSDLPLGAFTVAVDHQTVTVSLVHSALAKLCRWSVYDSGELKVREGLGTSDVFRALPLGTYTIVSSVSSGISTFDSQSKKVSVTEYDVEDGLEDGAGGDDLRTLYYAAMAGLILFFAAIIIRVVL